MTCENYTEIVTDDAEILKMIGKALLIITYAIPKKRIGKPHLFRHILN